MGDAGGTAADDTASAPEVRDATEAEEASAAAVWEARMESGKLVCVAVKVDWGWGKVPGLVPFTTIIK